MKVVILAGGLGTRLAEETDRTPKPMVHIGTKPILWHVMKIYSQFGLNDFIICAGYKAHTIVEYFVNYRLYNSDVVVDLGKSLTSCLNESREAWNVTIIDTGLNTETGGRLLRIRDHLPRGEPFCMTYGDGVGNVNIQQAIDFHKQRRFTATMTAVRPPARFGSAVIQDGVVRSFSEKPVGGEGYINGGFFVLEPSVLDLIAGDGTVFEHDPMETLSKRGALGAYVHADFWHPMDTLRDRRYLEQLWNSGKAPWKWWDD